MKKLLLSLVLLGVLAAVVFWSNSNNISTLQTKPGKSIDKDAYSKIISSGPVASDADIMTNEWASSVKESGVLRVGGTMTSQLFSLMDEKDGKVRGFDAGLFQLLTRYIFGDETKCEITQVDAGSRESVLENGEVDIVCATYSITDSRKQLVDFAGPYYASKQGILVTAGNDKIHRVDDLAGKAVATQSGSTGPEILAKYAPEATILEYETDAEARLALEQGLVDAYVTDYTLLLNAMVQSPHLYQIAGEQFGSEDDYGIGLPKDSSGTAFVNSFLKTIEEDGIWEELWHVCIGDRTDITEIPKGVRPH